jgi:hypothetical protein
MLRRVIQFGSFFAILAMAYAAPRDADAALAHRYSFNGNVNDSVGTANGTLVDAGNPTATFTGGQLDLTGNVGEGSNGITEDAYVDLPNGLISSTATTNGALSFELWTTISTVRTWQRLVDFGTSNGGEDVSDGANNTNYLYISPSHGRFNNGIATEVHQPDVAFEVGLAGAPVTNRQYHLVGTYDHNDTAAGANPNGTTRLYIDGTLIGSVQLAPNVNLRTLTDNNNWIGRSQWNDAVFDGLINEFRIYNHALTQAEVNQGVLFGPDVVNPGGTLSIEVNKSTGNISLKNTAAAPLTLEHYRISSAGGALNLAGWNSLDDQNFGAVDGPDPGTGAGDSVGEGWDQAGGSSANQLVEQFLGELGSTIGATTTISLGNAYNTAIFGAADGDLQFQFGLNNGGLITSTVSYVGGGGQPGDFDLDLDVDGNDFLVWQRGVGAAHNSATLATWKANFGAHPATAAAGAVPEPACLALLLTAGMALVARRNVV